MEAEKREKEPLFIRRHLSKDRKEARVGARLLSGTQRASMEEWTAPGFWGQTGLESWFMAMGKLLYFSVCLSSVK